MSCLSTASSEDNIPTDNLEQIAQYVSVESISPLPKLTRPAGIKRRAASRSTVLTSSPQKRSVGEKVPKKSHVTNSARKPRARKIGTNSANKVRKIRQTVTRNTNNHSSSNSTDYYSIVCGESIMMKIGFSIAVAANGRMKLVLMLPMKSTTIVTSACNILVKTFNI